MQADTDDCAVFFVSPSSSPSISYVHVAPYHFVLSRIASLQQLDRAVQKEDLTFLDDVEQDLPLASAPALPQKQSGRSRSSGRTASGGRRGTQREVQHSSANHEKKMVRESREIKRKSGDDRRLSSSKKKSESDAHALELWHSDGEEALEKVRSELYLLDTQHFNACGYNDNSARCRSLGKIRDTKNALVGGLMELQRKDRTAAAAATAYTLWSANASEEDEATPEPGSQQEQRLEEIMVKLGRGTFHSAPGTNVPAADQQRSGTAATTLTLATGGSPGGRSRKGVAIQSPKSVTTTAILLLLGGLSTALAAHFAKSKRGVRKAVVQRGANGASWKRGAMSRSEATDELVQSRDGTFLVRNSISRKGASLLSVKSGAIVVHDKIVKNRDHRFELIRPGGTAKQQPGFSSIAKLVAHYSGNSRSCVPYRLRITPHG
jgi:hypothetical protein